MRFLGADFKKSDVSRKRIVERYVRNKAEAGTLRPVKIAQRGGATLILEAPILTIRAKLKSRGFLLKGKPGPKYTWSHLEHRQIITLYNSVYRGISNYYKFAANRGRLESLLR